MGSARVPTLAGLVACSDIDPLAVGSRARICTARAGVARHELPHPAALGVHATADASGSLPCSVAAPAHGRMHDR